MTIKKLFKAMAVTLCLLLLASCEKGVKPPLVFGAGAWPGFEPVYLAGDLGYLPAEHVRLVQYASAGEVRQAFLSHSIHVAGLSLEDALALRRDLPDLKIVLVFGQARAGDKAFEVLVTRDDDIGDYHREMVQFAQGWRRALDYVHNEPAKAILAMAKHAHLDSQQFDKAWQDVDLFDVQRNRALLAGDNPELGARINAVQRDMLSKGRLSIGVEPAMLLDGSLLAGTGA